jgi:hypothetical protein
VNREIEGSYPNERLLFFGMDDQVREVVYASEFESGEAHRIRARLEEAGTLKAIVHISATALGGKSGSGPRYSTIEYLPDRSYYVRAHRVVPSTWVTRSDIIESAVDATQKLFDIEKEE